MKLILIAALSGAFLATSVHCQSSASGGPKFSLEEIMLLADAAEKANKKGTDEEQTSNFQHRLKQLVQTARVAAGSGQSTGNDVIDQTIRQVRARINASGGGATISDTSIFDAALRAVGAGSGQPAAATPTNLVDTVIQQFQKTGDQSTTTPAPQQDSFLGGIIRQLADGNKNSQSGGTGGTILDAVVNQLVSTTTTTTTTTTPAPASGVLQILDGLVKSYQAQKAPSGESPGGSTMQTTAILDGLKGLLAKIQLPRAENGSNATQGGPGADQLIEGFLNQIKQIQNRGSPSSDTSAQSSPTPNQQSMPDIGALLKQVQSAFSDRMGTTTPSSEEDFIKKAAAEVIRDSSDKPTSAPAIADTTAVRSATTANPLSKFLSEDPSKLLGTILSKVGAGGTAGAGDDRSKALQGFLKNLFPKRR